MTNKEISLKYLMFILRFNDFHNLDKSMIIDLLNARISTSRKYICITRPRRFGKSEITYLIESYYSKAVNSKAIFDSLSISNAPSYEKYLNKYNVIKIDFSTLDTLNLNFKQYLNAITSQLASELEKHYTGLEKYPDIASKLLATKDKFIFIFDEWDFIFNKGLYPENQESFLEFLRILLKGRSYVALCYMTGILPIKKHSSGSALNMFQEFTLLTDNIFGNYFGFTEGCFTAKQKQQNKHIFLYCCYFIHKMGILYVRRYKEYKEKD